jgi:choline dehydrogenase-like flavoprotein
LGRDLAGKRNVSIVLRANVMEVVPDAAESCILALRVRGGSSREIIVRADYFVLCAGGIESARLLLASDRRAENGVGNGNDLVGRYFQDHPGVIVGPIHGTDRSRTRSTFRPRRIKGVRYQPLFRASDRLQIDRALLNVGGSIIWPPSRSIEAAKDIFRAVHARNVSADTKRAVGEVAKHPVAAARAAGRYFVLRQPAIETSGAPILTVGGEQRPNRDSRVYLGTKCDELGMRRVVLDWRLTEHELETWRGFTAVMAEQIELAGYGTVMLDEFNLPDDPAALAGMVIDAGHHMGTTRMATDDSHGVVDSDCRVFGVENLFIVSSSVFPTSGFSNPTLTIMALAIRLADLLKSQVRGG